MGSIQHRPDGLIRAVAGLASPIEFSGGGPRSATHRANQVASPPATLSALRAHCFGWIDVSDLPSSSGERPCPSNAIRPHPNAWFRSTIKSSGSSIATETPAVSAGVIHWRPPWPLDRPARNPRLSVSLPSATAPYFATLRRRNSCFIALTWARYVATSWSPQRSPAVRWKPRRVKGGDAAPQRWIIAASACFCCWLAVAFGWRARTAARLRSRNTAVTR